MEIYSALPYDIVKRIRQNMVSQDDVMDGKDSSYASTPNGKIEIRFSNHCTHLWTWHERKYGNYDDITRISIVFEENDTYSDENLVLKRPRKTKLKVMEYVYRIANPQEFTKDDVKLVINSINMALRNGRDEDYTGKLTYKKERISKNPSSSCNENKYTKSIISMKKKINESQLRKIVAESVKRVLKESADSVSPQPFDGYSSYSSSEDEIRSAEEFYAKNCPWRKWPNAQTIEGLITCAYHLRNDFDSGKYSYNHLICDLYHMCN